MYFGMSLACCDVACWLTRCCDSLAAQGGIKRTRATSQTYTRASQNTVARTSDAKKPLEPSPPKLVRHTGPWCDCARQFRKQPPDRRDAQSLRQAQVYLTAHGSTRRKDCRRETLLKPPPPNLQASPCHRYDCARYVGAQLRDRTHA